MFAAWRENATWVEQDQAIRTDEVDSASTGLAAQQEYELLALRVVELINELLALGDRHRAVQTEEPIPTGAMFDVIVAEHDGYQRTFYFEAFSRRCPAFGYNY